MLPLLAERARRTFRLEPFPQPELVRTRYPVLLMHGFGALASLLGRGLLHHQAMHLRAHGVLAYAPRVNPYDTVEVRAGVWARCVDRVLEETGAERLNIVAFSAGGLDARRLVSTLGYADRVASVITVSTPHHGSGLCDFLHERPERLRRFAYGVMDLCGRLTFENAVPRVEEAIRELTPAHVCDRFNPDHPDAEGVFYGSWAGRAGMGTDVPISPALLFYNRTLYRIAGVNDGFVPVESARWGEFMGIVEADHARQAGMTRGTTPDANRLFLTIARDLARRGF